MNAETEMKALAIIEKAVDDVDEGQGISRLIDDAVKYIFRKTDIQAIIVLWPNGYEDIRAQIDDYVSEPKETMLSDYDLTYMKDRETRLEVSQ